MSKRKQVGTSTELLRQHQIKALKAACGAWEDKDHPELRHGSAEWIKRLRAESKRRLKRPNAR